MLLDDSPSIFVCNIIVLLQSFCFRHEKELFTFSLALNGWHIMCEADASNMLTEHRKHRWTRFQYTTLSANIPWQPCHPLTANALNINHLQDWIKSCCELNWIFISEWIWQRLQWFCVSNKIYRLCLCVFVCGVLQIDWIITTWIIKYDSNGKTHFTQNFEHASIEVLN